MSFFIIKKLVCTTLRGSHTHITQVTQHSLLRSCMIGDKEWGSRPAMKAAAADAIKKWVEQMYAQEVVTTRVDTASGKIDTDEGMPILEYWIRWQEREGVWIHDDVLPSYQ